MTTHIPSIVEMWETFAAQLPTGVSRGTDLYGYLRDTWYAATYQTLVTVQHHARKSADEEGFGTAMKMLFDEAEALVDEHLKRTEIS